MLIYEGYEVNVKLSRCLYLFTNVISLIGMLNYSFVQLVNQLNVEGHLVVNCDSIAILILSTLIDYCYIFGPFIQAMFLLYLVHEISKIDANDTTLYEEGDER